MPQQGFLIDKKWYVLGDRLDASSMHERIAKEYAARALSRVYIAIAVGFFLLGIFLLIFPSWVFVFPTRETWLIPSFGTICFSIGLYFGCLFLMHQSQSHHREIFIPKCPDGIVLPELQSVDSSAKELIDIFSFFDDASLKILESTFELGTKFGHKFVEPLHLFVSSLDDDSVMTVFVRLGIAFVPMKDPLGRRLSTRALGTSQGLHVLTKEVLLNAFRNAYFQRRDAVTPLELFFEAYLHDEFLQDVFSAQNIDTTQCENMVEWLRINEKICEQYARFKKAVASKPIGAMNRAMTSIATPMLDAISEDLTTAAVLGNLPMVIGRESEIEQVFRVIEGGRESVVLVGAPGVGKESVIDGIAGRMVEERVPEILKDKRLVRISISHFASGVSMQEAQERLLLALNEVERSRNIILVMQEIDLLSHDLATLLVEYLSRRGTFVIATCTPQSYADTIERSVLARLFQKVIVDEPDKKNAIHILESKIGAMEHEFHVIFTYDAVEKAVALSDRYMHDAYLPKKAIEIARETAQQVSRTQEEGAKIARVTGEDVAKIISTKTGIPVTRVAEEEKNTLLHLEEAMHQRVIGQDEAVKAVASAIRRARADMRSISRPIASFLFLGPTGVGKTELAKTLAATYFGSEQMMVRVDMSEYQDVRSLDRLIGTPGSNQGGLFTEAVRAHPFCIILLDELEKADTHVLNVFLQVLDDGRVTDATGRVIDFSNTIVIATSNAGSSYIQEALTRGENIDTIKIHLFEEELKQVYRPEFLNRFDGVIVFRPLTQEQITHMTRRMVSEVAKRLEAKGIGFEVTDAAILEFATKGFDSKYGARPLRRVVQEQVENTIASALLEGNVLRRDTIVLDEGGKMTIQKAQPL